METLEKSRVCRLCGKECQISVNIFDKNENHVRKINAILPILVHEMDFLPKQMCHRCSYRLEEFYNFYVECAKTDSDLKSQLSWMRKESSKEEIITPMVKMNPFKIKTEPPDCKDSDSNDVFGHFSSYDSFTSPILTCSRCRCLCDPTVKASKSPTEVKTFSKGLKTQPQCTDASTDFCNKNGESSKSESVNRNFQTEALKSSGSFKDISVIAKQQLLISENKIPVVVIDSNDCNVSQDNNDLKNRALRPRKGSVDYIGPKKKVVHRLREKFKNKVDIFDSEIVDPVKVVVTSSNSLHPSPIIKLEKVDDTLKSIRVRKNLEEFNKRVKELGHTRRLHGDEDLNNKILRRLKNRSRKSFQKEENLKKKGLYKQEKLKRKSLQLEKAESCVSGNVENVINEECQSKKILVSEENQNKKMSQRKVEQKKQCLQNGFNQCNKILRLEDVNDQQCTTNDVQTSANNRMQNSEVNIKQEIAKITTENNRATEQQLPGQENKCIIDLEQNQKTQKLMDKFPMYPVVKLEKDYTCNVDYPRVKIKRHLAVVDLAKSVNGALDNPIETDIVLQDKALSKSDKSLESKSSKRKEKKLKSINGAGSVGKVSKKKHKQVDLTNVKKVIAEQQSSTIIPQTELKYFCEECDTCFKSRELFRLHPCYQN